MSYKRVIRDIRTLSQDEGYRDDEIAIAIGCSRATVNRTRIKYEIPIANLSNRKDKTYVCGTCKKTITIRRKDRKQTTCPDCKLKESR